MVDLEKLNELKTRLLELEGIDNDTVSFYEVFVNKTESVHALIIDDTKYENKPDVVFVHGLTGTSLQYFLCFKELSKYIRIIAIDLPGMGLSNRIDIDPDDYNTQSTEEFFVTKLFTAFEILGLKKFSFVSHSFGAYISGLFTINYPHMVESLILLSPVGVSSYYTETVSTKIEDLFMRVLYYFKKAPTDGYKILGLLAKPLFEKLMYKKLERIKNEEEAQVFAQIMLSVFSLEATSEKLIYKLFDANIRAYKPLLLYFEIFESAKIDFIYGDSDWNPVDQAEEFKAKLPNITNIELLENSGHIVVCDNPEVLSKLILKIFARNNLIVMNNIQSL